MNTYKLKGYPKAKKRQYNIQEAKRLSEKGKTIKEISEKLNVSKEQVCLYLGIHATRVGVVEATKRKIRRIENLIQGAEQQKKTLEEFIKKHEQKEALL